MQLFTSLKTVVKHIVLSEESEKPTMSTLNSAGAKLITITATLANGMICETLQQDLIANSVR